MAANQPEPTDDVALATALMAMARGYRISKVIYVTANLGLADLLGDGAKSVEALAQETETHPPSLARLLRALAAFGIVAEAAPGHFILTPLGACLRADAPLSVRDAVLMFGGDDFWTTWADLPHCVATGESATSHLYGTANNFDFYAQHPELNTLMNAGFTAMARSVAQAVVAAYRFPENVVIVDVGGGQGQLLMTILQAQPTARGVLFDQPHVVERAGPLLERGVASGRCAVVGGNMFEEVPPGGDIYVLSRVLHDWSDDEAQSILQNCRRAARPGATLLVVEQVLADRPEVSPREQQVTLSDLNMLVRMHGRERTEHEFRTLLAGAGFAWRGVTDTQSNYCVVAGVCTDDGGAISGEDMTGARVGDGVAQAHITAQTGSPHPTP